MSLLTFSISNFSVSKSLGILDTEGIRNNNNNNNNKLANELAEKSAFYVNNSPF